VLTEKKLNDIMPGEYGWAGKLLNGFMVGLDGLKLFSTSAWGRWMDFI